MVSDDSDETESVVAKVRHLFSPGNQSESRFYSISTLSTFDRRFQK
jgi:hypothetical protein